MTSPVYEEVPKTSDKKWGRGNEVHANSDITTKEKIMYKFLFFGQRGSS